MQSYKDNFQFLSINFIRFTFIGLNADSFIINCNIKIFIWFFYIVTFLIFYCLKKKLAQKSQKKISDFFNFSATLSLFMCCMMPFGFASFIEIQNIRKTLPFKLASVSSSFFILATIFFFLYSVTIISMKAMSNYHNEKFLRRYLSMLKPFKN